MTALGQHKLHIARHGSSGAVEQWNSGAMEQWSNGAMEQWSSGQSELRGWTDSHLLLSPPTRSSSHTSVTTSASKFRGDVKFGPQHEKLSK